MRRFSKVDGYTCESLKDTEYYAARDNDAMLCQKWEKDECDKAKRCNYATKASAGVLYKKCRKVKVIYWLEAYEFREQVIFP